MIHRFIFSCAVATALCASAQIDGGISVTGMGSVSVKPSIAKLTFGVSANAEIAGDAITRFEQTRERVMEAIKKLEIPDAVLEQEAFTIGLGSGSDSRMAQMRMMQGNTQKTPSQVVLSQPVTVVLNNIDKLKREEVIDRLSRIIDTARDLGLSLSSAGGEGSVQFLIADPEAASANALEAALDDARKRAEKIAARAKVKLGPVVAIDAQNAESGSKRSATRIQYDAWGRPHTVPAGDQNDAFSELTIDAAVSVRFQILSN